MKGRIYSIQRFCIHDGPGIRTTVFFKGCPMSCLWCSNPESQCIEPEITYDKSLCKLCGHCVNACPTSAISYDEPRVSIKIDKIKCDLCGICVKQCNYRALKFEGELLSVDDVVNVLERDKVFYDKSGGGITLSGGEVLLQPEFAQELIKECKQRNFNVAIETAGYTDEDTFRKTVKDVDLLLFDIKSVEDEKHRKFTGVSNLRIIENLFVARDMGKNVIIRVPVVPGFNDSILDMKAIANIAQRAGINRVDLLLFHQFGAGKYNLLGKPYFMSDIDVLETHLVEELKNVFETQNIIVNIG